MDYLRQVFHIIFAISVQYILLDCEIKCIRKRYLLGLYAAFVILCDGFVLFQFGYIYFMKLYPLLVNLPILLAFVYLSKFVPIKVFFIILTVIAICTSMTATGIIVSYFFDSSMFVVNLVCYLLYIPIWLVIYKYIRPTFLYMLRNTDTKGWVGFCVVPLSYCVLLYSHGNYNLASVDIGQIIKYLVLYFILAFSAYYMIFRFFRQTREQLTLQSEQNLLINQVAAAQLHFEALEESQEKIILYRHDMRHHLALINSYLADNNKESAQKYIREVEKTIDHAAVEKYCSNYTVNLILSSHIMHARKEEIEVETHIDLPEENAVSDMDLCVIFGNVIENAINACKRIANSGDRFIKIVCKNKQNKLFIQIMNSYEGVLEFDGDMPLSHEENHGLGTKSVAAIAQKYGAVYSFSAEEGVFTTRIIL
ncbi:MAG: hypothetical protein K0Q85_928 [Caproiciproducens sp.]|jgi:hypothetical protein|nr:hypothetical protein [Caproiciproducens sp.]